MPEIIPLSSLTTEAGRLHVLKKSSFVLVIKDLLYLDLMCISSSFEYYGRTLGSGARPAGYEDVIGARGGSVKNIG